MNTGGFQGVLAGLIRQRGVTGALIVSERDGIVVDQVVQVGVRADVVAALAASLYRRARLAAEAAGFGDTGVLQMDAERGKVCAIGRGDLVIVVVTETAANVGLVRVEMLKGLEALA
jgi:predicted regulator of Ras-like GTPase activity (Roadblock/LC7/MglB family)